MSRIVTVIPTFRRPQLLVRAVNSVLSQNSECEAWVFDDASDDDTESVVRQLGPRVRYQRNLVNLGMMGYPNTNLAVHAVDAEFFTILNDDDYLLPGFFDTALQYFTANPAVSAFAGREIFWDVNRPRKTRPYFDVTEQLYDAPVGALALMEADQIHTWPSVMWRRLGDEYVDESLGYSADLDFILREFMRRTILVHPHLCAVYCLHEGSLSSNRVFVTRLKSMTMILKKYERNPQFFALLKRTFHKHILLGTLDAIGTGYLRDAHAGIEAENAIGRIRYARILGVLAALPAARKPIQWAKAIRNRVRSHPDRAACLGAIGVTRNIDSLCTRELLSVH